MYDDSKRHLKMYQVEFRDSPAKKSVRELRSTRRADRNRSGLAFNLNYMTSHLNSISSQQQTGSRILDNSMLEYANASRLRRKITRRFCSCTHLECAPEASGDT